MKSLFYTLIAVVSFMTLSARADYSAAQEADNPYHEWERLDDDRWWFPPDWFKKDHDFSRVIPERAGAKHNFNPVQWQDVSLNKDSQRARKQILDEAMRYNILSEVLTADITLPTVVVGANYNKLGFADRQVLLETIAMSVGLPRQEGKIILIEDKDGGQLARYDAKSGLYEITAISDRRRNWWGRQWEALFGTGSAN